MALKKISIVIALSLVVGSPICAMAAEDYPAFPLSDPTADCREATRLGGTAAFNYCINQEQLYYDLAKSDWVAVTNENRTYCIQLMGKGAPRTFYQGLEVCLNQRLRMQAAETPAEFHY